jgi:FAD/FMN-containing dehydrogenase
MPSYLQVDPGWLPLGPSGSRLFCHTVICNHDVEAECRALISPVATRADVVLNTLKMQSYLSWQLKHSSITAAQHGYLYLTNLMIPPGVLTPKVMGRIQRAVLSAPSARNLVIMHLGGGAIGRVDPAATAFPHRDSQFVLQIKAIWKEDSKAKQRANMAWVAALKVWLAPLSTGSYVNYMDPALEGWPLKYYGSNLPRLQAIKTALDPHNFFVFNQSVPPTPPSTPSPTPA